MIAPNHMFSIMQIAQVQLKAATSNLNRGKHVANSLESSIGQYQESLKTLEATGHPEKAWLTVGIPTVPRKNEADYLTRTLESLLEELPLDPTDPMYANVRIVVMNNQKGNHSVFYKVPVCKQSQQFCVKCSVSILHISRRGDARHHICSVKLTKCQDICVSNGQGVTAVRWSWLTNGRKSQSQSKFRPSIYRKG